MIVELCLWIAVIFLLTAVFGLLREIIRLKRLIRYANREVDWGNPVGKEIW